MGRLSRGECCGLRRARVREQGIGDPSSPQRLRCNRASASPVSTVSQLHRPARVACVPEVRAPTAAPHGGRAVQGASKTSGLGEPVLALAQGPARRAAGFAASHAARRSCPRTTQESGATSAFSAENGHYCAVFSAAYSSARRAPGFAVDNPARPRYFNN